MTSAQKVIKYLAIAFAIFLIITIISAILNAFYALSGVLGLRKDNEISSGEISTTNFEDIDIATLDIDVTYTNLTIKSGDFFKAETNNSDISFSQNNQDLQIKEKSHKWFSKNENQQLVLYMPKNLELEKVKINAGAGEINIENLTTKKLSFELGAGKTEIRSLNVRKECEIEGGAGKISITSGTINDLKLDMGLGEVNLNAILTGESEINAGVGNLNVKLQNGKESYKIKTDKGLGTIKIDGKEISDSEVYGDGENSIKLEGGIGNIKIDFK